MSIPLPPGTVPPDADIRLLTIPRTLDTADAGEFLEMVRVRNLVYREISGTDDEALGPGELLPHYQPSPFEERLLWGIWWRGEFVGRAGIDFPGEHGSTVGYAQIEVLRHSWGHGLGAAALDLIESAARERGRSIIQSWIEHPSAPGRQLAPPTGSGSIPWDHPARFASTHGYTLEQVERKSILDLSDAALDARRDALSAAARDASTAYEVVFWTPPTPAAFVTDFAWMKSRMTTDAPAAALEIESERWDAERVAEYDRLSAESGREHLVTAARHRASGRLVAFTELTATPGSEVTQQEDTLVVAEHRGHRLGTLIKCAALQHWRARHPRTSRILTYNAEENRPMLDVNEAMGFRPVAYTGAWKKTLSPASGADADTAGRSGSTGS